MPMPGSLPCGRRAESVEQVAQRPPPSRGSRGPAAFRMWRSRPGPAPRQGGFVCSAAGRANRCGSCCRARRRPMRWCPPVLDAPSVALMAAVGRGCRCLGRSQVVMHADLVDSKHPSFKSWVPAPSLVCSHSSTGASIPTQGALCGAAAAAAAVRLPRMPRNRRPAPPRRLRGPPVRHTAKQHKSSSTHRRPARVCARPGVLRVAAAACPSSAFCCLLRFDLGFVSPHQPFLSQRSLLGVC